MLSNNLLNCNQNGNEEFARASLALLGNFCTNMSAITMSKEQWAL